MAQRTEKLRIYLTEYEAALIGDIAKQRSMFVSTFARQAVLDRCRDLVEGGRAIDRVADMLRADDDAEDYDDYS